MHTGRSGKSGILSTHGFFMYYKDKLGANKDISKGSVRTHWGCSLKNRTGCTAKATTLSSLNLVWPKLRQY